MSEDLPPLFMSGCGCWKLQARLDLYMLGQCLFEDAICCSDVAFIDGLLALAGGGPSSPLLPSARQLWWSSVLDR
jgi:hypothetical protein